MNKLREVRKEKGLTLNEVGKQIGLKNNTLSQYETGKREPKLETWKKLAKFYKFPVSYLQDIDVDDTIGQVNFNDLSTLGLFFYENKDWDKKENLENEIKLHENMVNNILYGPKESALNAINAYIEFISNLKDEVNNFDENTFMNDYLNNVVAEQCWDPANNELATMNNDFIREILKRANDGNKQLESSIVKKYIYDETDILDSYLEYKKKNNEDTTKLESFLKKRKEKFRQEHPEFYK